ncbi:MAG: trigger factor [Patescibacteria group bacterium]
MNATIKKLPESKIEIAGEVAASIFDEYIKKATQKFVVVAELDGFRKGKAPENLVVQRVGDDKILHEAAELALQTEWPHVLKENTIEAIGPAEFHILKMARGNALAWKAIVAVLPEIILPDYKAIAIKVNAKKSTAPIEIADKEVDETITYIHRSRTKNPPVEGEPAVPIDDTFAQSLGNFATLAALKENIRDGLRLEREAKQIEEHKNNIISEIAAAAKVEIPAVMVDGERQKMLRELQASISDMGLEWSAYLAHMKTTEEEIQKGWHKDAEKRARIGLTLHAIARQEKIEPTVEEVNEKLDRMLTPYSEEEVRKIDQRAARDYAVSIAGNEKVLAFLEAQK